GPDEDIDDLLANREANITSEKTALAKRIHDLEARLKEEKALHEWTQKECRHANEKLDVKDELIETLFKRIEDLTGEKRKTKTA
ncbi:MAG: hypothetical protein K9H64_21800, partial [Bacteroidales bacterium]|nr:hypothetical protein [Bacteroidales bacterium]MCF8458624.1 hypothetical protein [Bacteroidales bacterium]